MTNLILCGGAGTRLWPISRSSVPKQYFQLFGKESLFQRTIRRNKKLCRDFFVASSLDTAFIAEQQLALEGVEKVRYLLEPVGRNTAPALALAALACPPETVFFVTPSDHVINDEEALARAVQRAEELAQQGFLVTFGIKPDYPETGFGYIEAKGEDVLSFREKPDRVTAEGYIKAGNYYWNSGMFCFRGDVLLSELEQHASKVLEFARHALKNPSHERLTPSLEEMERIPSISIDYAVMEKSRLIKVVPVSMGWSDLGSFDGIWEHGKRDPLGNVFLGARSPETFSASNNLVVGSERDIALVDVSNLIVVDTPDALLLCARGSSQKVKEVVQSYREKNPTLLENHLTVPRPWGQFTVLMDTASFKVKRIDVIPGRRLSLQKHRYREEHWTVVEGRARVIIGQNEMELTRGGRAFIPRGEIHRLENIGEELLSIIEVQIGDYFGEDDIIRIEDDYNRQQFS